MKVRLLVFLTLATQAFSLRLQPAPRSESKDVAECKAQFDHLSKELKEDLDNPALMCEPLPEDRMALAKERLEIEKKVGEELEGPFVKTRVSVAKDPQRSRTHVLIVGPESSGTHFIMKAIGNIFGIQDVKEDTYTEDVILHHVSLPENGVCSDKSVQVLDDYGCQPGGCPQQVNTHSRRVVVNVKSVVEKYRQRRESIKVVQMARDPDISMLANHNRKHCEDEAIAFHENKMAFQLMLKAKDLPEVTTISYEQLIWEGTPYMKKKLAQAGFDVSRVALPAVSNENAKYSVSQRVCTYSASAYMALCPDSPHTAMLQDMGCHEIR